MRSRKLATSSDQLFFRFCYTLLCKSIWFNSLAKAPTLLSQNSSKTRICEINISTILEIVFKKQRIYSNSADLRFFLAKLWLAQRSPYLVPHVPLNRT